MGGGGGWLTIHKANHQSFSPLPLDTFGFEEKNQRSLHHLTDIPSFSAAKGRREKKKEKREREKKGNSLQ